MGQETKNKELKTNAEKITGSMKNMYYFLVGVSIVIPVLFLFKFMYLEVLTADGAVATHTQFYFFTSFKFIAEVFNETADGLFFSLMCIIPTVLILWGIVECIISVVRALKVKISWKHGELCVKAYTRILISTAATWLIYMITDPFFNIKTGFAKQTLTFNPTIYIAFGLALVGRIVAGIYFKQIREKHLF